MICDRRVSAKVKGKVSKTVVRPAMMSGLETLASQKTGGRAGGGRAKDAEILCRGDKDGQDQELEGPRRQEGLEEKLERPY